MEQADTTTGLRWAVASTIRFPSPPASSANMREDLRCWPEPGRPSGTRSTHVSTTAAGLLMSIFHWRAALPGSQLRSFPLVKASPTKSSEIAYFRQQSASTIPASTTKCRFQPSTISRPATFRPSGSATSPRVFQADHRSIRYVVWLDLQLPRSDRSYGGGSQRLEPETTFKYRVFKNPEHEFVMSVGVSIEWGGTGAKVGADPSTPTHQNVFRQRARRTSRHPVMDQAGRHNRSDRLRHTGQNSTTTLFSVDPDSGDLAADTEFHSRVLNWGA